MADISFNCPECKGNLAVDDSAAGMTLSCPLCSKSIKVPSNAESGAASGSNTNDSVACPYCGEQILSTAIKCKHCGEFLDGRSPLQQPRQYPAHLLQNNIDTKRRLPQAVELTAKKYKAQGCLAVIVIAIGLIIGMYGGAAPNSAAATIGGALFLIGLLWAIIVRLMAWWDRG